MFPFKDTGCHDNILFQDAWNRWFWGEHSTKENNRAKGWKMFPCIQIGELQIASGKIEKDENCSSEFV